MDAATIMSPGIRNKKISWSKLFTSKKDGESRKLNVNEEYKEVFRTQSYAEIWSKVQSCSSSYAHLIEPSQEVALDVIKSSDLRLLLVDYLESSLDAYNVCELVLRGIHKTRSNHRHVRRAIKLSIGDGINKDDNNNNNITKQLACFARQANPISVILNEEVDFNLIHHKNSLLLQRLTSRRRKMKRRENVITYVVLAVAVLALAMHSVKKVKKGKGGPHSQLDVAAKAVYILMNEFDTMGRVVMRVHDEVDHFRALADMCVRNSKNQEVVKEALRELNLHEDGLAQQLEELEEHIYLCFLTINRSRRLVIQQILSS